MSGPFPTLLFLTGSFQGRGSEEGTAIRQGIAESLATGPFSINLPFRALRSDKEEHRVSFGRRVPTSVFGSVSDPEHPRSVDSLPKRDPKTPGPPCACSWRVSRKLADGGGAAKDRQRSSKPQAHRARASGEFSKNPADGRPFPRGVNRDCALRYSRYDRSPTDTLEAGWPDLDRRRNRWPTGAGCG